MANVSEVLDSSSIPEIDRLLGARSPMVVNLHACDITLTVALHLAVAYERLRQAGAGEYAQSIVNLGHPIVNQCIRRLTSDSSQESSDPFGAPSFDVYRIGSAHDLTSEEWVLFYDRFRRRAVSGRKGQMFRAVGDVLGEMGDNVVWHAFQHPDVPSPALAAFFVTDEVASFCVADAGIGFLTSLRRNPVWQHLASDHEALEAVVSRQATSRIGEASGGGFKQLFRSLLDFNGLVILRSGACTFRMSNVRDGRQVNATASSQVAGAEVTVSIALTGSPKEAILKKALIYPFI